MDNFAPGSTLQNGKYRIDAVLGKGGFGITYLAVHPMLFKKYAIKEFFPSQYCVRDAQTNMLNAFSASNAENFSRFRRKFMREARVLSQLNHPNIVSSVDVFEENNTAYYVMNFIDGRSLQEITAVGPLSLDYALHYTHKIGGALSYLHSRKIMHLDVKPGNIMVRNFDNEPILIDFGLAKNYSTDSGDSTTNSTSGISRGYSPIEQYTGEVKEFTTQCDLYALAATLYRMLTGKTPPEPSSLLNGGLPELPANVPASVALPMQWAMAVNQGNRYATIDEFLEQLPVDSNDARTKKPLPPRPQTRRTPPVTPPHNDDEIEVVIMEDDDDTLINNNNKKSAINNQNKKSAPSGSKHPPVNHGSNSGHGVHNGHAGFNNRNDYVERNAPAKKGSGKKIALIALIAFVTIFAICLGGYLYYDSEVAPYTIKEEKWDYVNSKIDYYNMHNELVWTTGIDFYDRSSNPVDAADVVVDEYGNTADKNGYVVYTYPHDILPSYLHY